MRSASCSPTRRSAASYGRTQAGMRPRNSHESYSLDEAAHRPAPAAAVETEDGLAIPAPASAAQPQWPGTDPHRPSGAAAFAAARGVKVPVIASPGEIVLAREIREQLRKRYLERPVETRAPRCVAPTK